MLLLLRKVTYTDYRENIEVVCGDAVLVTILSTTFCYILSEIISEWVSIRTKN